MKREPEENKSDQQELVDDFASRQRNTLWPDTLRNSSNVDAFLWNGSEHPTKLQRAGAAVFGLFFILAAIAIASVAAERHSILGGVLSIGSLYLGARMLWNTIPKRAKERRT